MPFKEPVRSRQRPRSCACRLSFAKKRIVWLNRKQELDACQDEAHSGGDEVFLPYGFIAEAPGHAFDQCGKISVVYGVRL